jgi:pilus assembly protein CpaB
MRFGTVIMFALALIFATGAAILVRVAFTGRDPDVAAKIAVVAVRDLKAGEKLTPDAVREVKFPADLLPAGAFASKDALFAGAPERILSASVPQQEPILAERLINASGSILGRMTPGMYGIAIRVNETSSVGGFVQPEDHVNVLLTQTEKVEGNPSHLPSTRTLLKNVRVLATDLQTQRRHDAQPPKTITLEVGEEDAKKLTLASAIGQLSLTLNRSEASADLGRVVDSRDLGGAPQKEAPSDDASVTIFRSVKRDEYRVPHQ